MANATIRIYLRWHLPFIYRQSAEISNITKHKMKKGEMPMIVFSDFICYRIKKYDRMEKTYEGIN